ncbi:MAG: hypothetical protein HY927_06580, partial [Elusimicrobia bacterium]|nr:hypothetical protein [Elusimicrobiota bacterium]
MNGFLPMLLTAALALQAVEAAWYDFARNENAPEISRMQVGGRQLEGSVELLTLYPDELQGGKLVVRGKAETTRGSVGTVLVSLDGGGDFQKAKVEKGGAFYFEFSPAVGQEYAFQIKALDTTGRASDPKAGAFKFVVRADQTRAEVLPAFNKLVELYKAEDRTGLMARMSDAFEGDRAALAKGLEADFADLSAIELEASVGRVGKTGSLVEVQYSFTRRAKSEAAGKAVRGRSAGRMSFAQEGGDFKLFSMGSPVLFGVEAAAGAAAEAERLQADIAEKETALKEKKLDKRKKASLEAEVAQAKRQLSEKAGAEVDRLQADIAEKEASLRDEKLDKQKKAALEAEVAQGKRELAQKAGAELERLQADIEQKEAALKDRKLDKEKKAALEAAVAEAKRDLSGKAGAEVDRLQVDIARKEAALKDKKLDKEKKADLEAQLADAKRELSGKAAAEAFKTPGQDLPKPENAAKLRAMAEEARETMDSAGLDFKAINAALRASGSMMNAKEFRAELDNLKAGRPYKGKDDIETFRKATASLESARAKAGVKLTDGELKDLERLKENFKKGADLEQEAQKQRDKKLEPLQKQLESATDEKQRKTLKEKMAEVEADYQNKSRELVDKYRQPLVEKIQRTAGLDASVGTDLYVRNPDGSVAKNPDGTNKLNPKHRGWSGDVDLRGSAKSVSDMREVLEGLDIDVDGAQGKGAGGKVTGGDVSTTHGAKPGLELTANIDDMDRRGAAKDSKAYQAEVDRLQADIARKEAALKDAKLDAPKKAALETEIAEARRARDRAALDHNAAQKRELSEKLGTGGSKDSFKQAGSSAHADKIEVDARSKETYVSVGMKEGQAGRTAVEVEDHFKKAVEGFKTPAQDLLKPENADKLQGMAKGARKSLDAVDLDYKEIEAALKASGSKMSVKEYRAELDSLKEGKTYKGTDDIETFKKATEAALESARGKAGLQAEVELKAQQNKIERLDADAKKLSGAELEANRAKRAQTASDMIDSKTRLEATRGANEERAGSTKRSGGGDGDAKAEARADKFGAGTKAAAGVATVVSTIDNARQIVEESDGSESDAQLVGKTVVKTMEGVLDIESKKRIILEEAEAAEKSGLTGTDKTIRQGIGVVVAGGRIVVDEVKGRVVDPVVNIGVAAQEGVGAVSDRYGQYKAEQDLEDFRNKGAVKEGGLTGKEALERGERKIKLNDGDTDVNLLKTRGDLTGKSDAYKTDALPVDDKGRLDIIKDIGGSLEDSLDSIRKLLDKPSGSLTPGEYAVVQKRLDDLAKQAAKTKTGLVLDVDGKEVGVGTKAVEKARLNDVGREIIRLQKKAENDAYKQKKAAEDREYEAAGKKWEEGQKKKAAEEDARSAAEQERKEREEAARKEREEREAEDREHERKSRLPDCDTVKIGVECNEKDEPAPEDGPAPELKGDCAEGEYLDVKWETRGNKNVAVGAKCVKDPNYKPEKPEPGRPGKGEPPPQEEPDPYDAEWQKNYDAYHADLDRAAEEKKRAREERSERCKNKDCYELPGFKLDIPEAQDSSWAVVFALNKDYATSMRGIYYDLDGRRKTVERQKAAILKKSEILGKKCEAVPPMPELKGVESATAFESTLKVVPRAELQSYQGALRQLKSHYGGAKGEIKAVLAEAGKLKQLVEAYNASVRNNAKPLGIINQSLDVLLPASAEKHVPIREIDDGGIAFACASLESLLDQVDDGVSGVDISLKKDAALEAMASATGVRVNQLKGAALKSVSDAELVLMARQLGHDPRSPELGAIVKQRFALYREVTLLPVGGADVHATRETLKHISAVVGTADKLLASEGRAQYFQEASRRLMEKLEALSKSVPAKIGADQQKALTNRHMAIYEDPLRGFLSGSEEANPVMAEFSRVARQISDAMTGDSKAEQGSPQSGQTQMVAAGGGQPMMMMDAEAPGIPGGGMMEGYAPVKGAAIIRGRVGNPPTAGPPSAEAPPPDALPGAPETGAPGHEPGVPEQSAPGTGMGRERTKTEVPDNRVFVPEKGPRTIVDPGFNIDRKEPVYRIQPDA